MLPGVATSDTDLVAELLAQHMTATGSDLVEALAAVLPSLEGAYSFVLVDDGQIIGARDPAGFRPLCLGRLPDGWVLASETPALDIVGADVRAGAGTRRDRRHRRQRPPHRARGPAG